MLFFGLSVTIVMQNYSWWEAEVWIVVIVSVYKAFVPSADPSLCHFYSPFLGRNNLHQETEDPTLIIESIVVFS